MQGRYRGPERASQRDLWARVDVRGYGYGEVRPLATLIDRSTGLVALDVGANKGFWSKAFLNELGDRVGMIHMFDPSPENVRELTVVEDNLIFAPEDFARLRVHATALGAARGRATLYTNEDGSPLASLHPHAVSGFAEESWRLTHSFEVEVDTVDAFLEREDVAFVDAMKLDVEGHEMAVLLGAERALTDGRVGALSFEFGSHQIESRCFFKDFFVQLSDWGFDLFQKRHGALEPVPRYDYRYEDFTRDYVFMAKKRT
jgi:FkbM family methyltransferase